MTNALKRSLRRVSATLAALAVAFTITGLAIAAPASAAPSDAVEDISIQGVGCSTGTGTSTDGPRLRHYAVGTCDDNSDGAFYQFKLIWSCTSEGYLRHSTFQPADGRRIYGFCPDGKRIDSKRTATYP